MPPSGPWGPALAPGRPQDDFAGVRHHVQFLVLDHAVQAHRALVQAGELPDRLGRDVDDGEIVQAAQGRDDALPPQVRCAAAVGDHHDVAVVEPLAAEPVRRRHARPRLGPAARPDAAPPVGLVRQRPAAGHQVRDGQPVEMAQFYAQDRQVLQWSDVPAGTKSFAVFCEDQEQLDKLGVERHEAVVAELADRDVQPGCGTDLDDGVGGQGGELADPQPGEIRLKVHALGLNRAEALFRSGFYIEEEIPGQSIGEVLAMTVDDANEFFKDEKAVIKRLAPLRDVGLGYLTLGQATSTLSGGESLAASVRRKARSCT